jgi:pimeloyl-ACP methyl ester carboxylesterase
MDFDYFAAPAILLLLGVLIAFLSVRQLRSLSRRSPHKGLRVFDRLILIAMIVGSASLAVAATYNAVALLRFHEFSRPPGQIYLVNGHRMRMNCTGAGSPTLVLDSGLGSDALTWGAVQPLLDKTTRVCSYDRAGFGWSDPVPGPRDADRIAAELHQLLAQANITGPLVLMGHSIAGMYIRDYAAHYPESVAGLVFVDSSTPLQDENPAIQAAGETGLPRLASVLVMRSVAIVGLPRLVGTCARPIPGFSGQAGQLLAEDLCHPRFASVEREFESFNASGQQTAHTGPFGSLPVLIFSQDPAKALTQKHPPRELVDLENAWGQMQESLKLLSTRSRRIVAKGSSHAVQVDRPELLGKEVSLFIEQIRGAAPPPETYGSTIIE